MTAQMESGAFLTVEHSSFPMDKIFSATDQRPAMDAAIDNGSAMRAE